MRGWALAGVAVNVLIVLTGAVVRLTASGLGCPTWPRCTGDSLVPVEDSEVPAVHMVIEFGNRMLTSVVLLVALCCTVAAFRLRTRRGALFPLALAQLLGVAAQAVIGGVTVLTGLYPTTVAAHFLVSAAIVAAAVSLYERAREGDAPALPLVRGEVVWLSRALLVAVGVVLVLGTVVTGAGPHAGDAAAPRFGFSIQRVAMLHADAVWAAVGLTFALWLVLRLTEAPRVARVRASQLLVVELAQGAIGYTQYFLHVPGGLVWLHVLGALLVWIAAWRVSFALRERDTASVPVTRAENPTRAAAP